MGNLLLLQYPESIEDACPKEAEYCECVYYDESFDRYIRFYIGLHLIDL